MPPVDFLKFPGTVLRQPAQPAVSTIQNFRKILVPYLGQQLTPEVAARLEAGLCGKVAPVDITQFEPVEHAGYRIGVERFAEIVHELHALHERHWQETERYRHGLPLAPDYEAMIDDEMRGNLVQFTVRRGTALVGNLRMYLWVSRHSGTMFAEEDTLYLEPEHRGGFLAMRLLRYAESVLRALGAREIHADSKLINNADVLMRRMGYTPVALKFVKVFNE
jgi:GNAT superfamily N-acetyltransferase